MNIQDLEQVKDELGEEGFEEAMGKLKEFVAPKFFDEKYLWEYDNPFFGDDGDFEVHFYCTTVADRLCFKESFVVSFYIKGEE